MQTHQTNRRGVTLVDVVAAATIALATTGLLAQGFLSDAQEVSRQNTCRNNLRILSQATFQYANSSSVEKLPGYISALVRDDENAYHDPRTGRTEPVSWVVQLLPQLDQGALYAAWRSSPATDAGGKAGGPPIDRTHKYLEFLVCPSDPQPDKEGPSLTYVANTGIPDFAAGGLPTRAARTACLCSACGGKEPGEKTPLHTMARDLVANGVFVDEFTSSRYFDPAAPVKGPKMSLVQVSDPKDKTILLTENVDAVAYATPGSYLSTKQEMYSTAEMTLGTIWAPNSRFSDTIPPTAEPPRESYKINVYGGFGDGTNYNYTRPSSKHVTGVNVAFVGMNVQFVSNKLSYFVYCKLMASNDALAGSLDAEGKRVPAPQSVRNYQLTDADVNP